ncbi:MAG: response regulator, partial [Acidobacteria bacterium]|nr:response regulator [Acidobacteriota bacterium]
RIKVLLVDDEREFRASAAQTLSRRGFDVRDAGSGAEALALLAEEKPDLVILDLKMAEMDGIATLSEIRKTHGALPVIILTGYGDFDSALSGIKLEIVDFLQKPVDIELLANRIRSLVAEPTIEVLKERTVADLMTPPDNYTTVYIDQKVREALVLLGESLSARVEGGLASIGRRSILVRDRHERLVGLLRFVDILKMIAPDWLASTPYRSFYTGMFLAQCKVFGEAPLSDYVNSDEMIIIGEDTPLMEAAVIMAEKRLINLPVMRGGKLIGVLRDKDLFEEIRRIAQA